MNSLVKNAADESQVKDAEGKVKRGREREIEDVRFILRHPQGRRFIWRYLETCRLHQTSADNSGSWTYFNEGMRNIGLKLMADIQEAQPEAYIEMLKEKKKETENNV